MLLVKICGITRLEDADAAIDAGAHALGFVFWPKSPRFIDPYRAREIVRALPSFVTPVGVFVNQSPEEVSAIASLVQLGAVQLHGDEPVADVEALRRPVIKALTLAAAENGRLDDWPKRVTVLIDVHDTERRGGTGRTIDWTAAASVASRRRIVLAGGLTPENVTDAVTVVRPFGIDVSSGVERAPGVKDHARIRTLFENLHAISHLTSRS
jgi:phosphoribosylanthranilate isomerase